MKGKQRKFLSIVLAAALVVAVIFSSFASFEVKAADTGDPYTIIGYNQNGIVKDKDGNTISGRAYCLDAKSNTPNAAYRYYRYKLSDNISYTKDYDLAAKTFPDNVKNRLVKLLVGKQDILNYLYNVSWDAEYEWYKQYTDYDNQDSTTQADIESTFEKSWKDLFCDTSGTTMQKLVWLCVHDDSEWPAFVNDNVNDTANGKHPDNYYYTEEGIKPFYYVSSDDLNDPHSLWNVFYVTAIQYIDSLPDYRTQGWDAYIYMTSDSGAQNMLGTAFQDTTDVNISKVDITSKQELDGAHLQVIDSNGTIVDEWDSQAGVVHTVKDLVRTTYTLRETVAPAGYAITSDITFTIDLKGNVTSTAPINDQGVILVEDSLITVDITKVDESGAGLSGASFEVYDDAGKKVDSWDSDTQAHRINGLTAGTNYVLKETASPFGYSIDEASITFSVDQYGAVSLAQNYKGVAVSSDKKGIVVTNRQNAVYISKRQIGGSGELAGATLQVIAKSDLNSDGKIKAGASTVDEWVSGTAEHKVVNIQAGTDYVLRETVAPAGFGRISSDITFSVDKDGNVTTSDAKVENGIILVEDSINTVTISKQDATNKEELEGATLTLTGKADWENMVLPRFAADDEHNIEKITSESGEVTGIKWTSTKNKLSIEGLNLDTAYTLHEEGAPAGYNYAEDITFRLEAGPNGTAIMVYDSESGQYKEKSGVVMLDEVKTKDTTTGTAQTIPNKENTTEQKTDQPTTEQPTTEVKQPTTEVKQPNTEAKQPTTEVKEPTPQTNPGPGTGVRTGDSVMVIPYIVIMIASLSMVVTIFAIKRKETKKEDVE